jgi:hypothetical protein
MGTNSKENVGLCLAPYYVGGGNIANGEAVVMDSPDSTSVRSHDAQNFGVEPKSLWDIVGRGRDRLCPSTLDVPKPLS